MYVIKYAVPFVISHVIPDAIMYEHEIASPSSQQHPTPNLPIKPQLGRIGKGARPAQRAPFALCGEWNPGAVRRAERAARRVEGRDDADGAP